MARWGKNLVLPLDSLIKEKENTNRPIPARSAGTVGKWGKMGFTSTRTYAFKALATGAAVAVTQPEITSTDNIESPTIESSEPPKPKKFFKSRNAPIDMIRTQIIQHLPRAPPSPDREIITNVSPAKKEPPAIKIKISKQTPERKKSTSSDKGSSKSKKKKDVKKLKPEAPPSRILPRQRKLINYNEEDEEDERSRTPLPPAREITVPTSESNINLEVSKDIQETDLQQQQTNLQQHKELEPSHVTEDEQRVEAESEHERDPQPELEMEPPPTVQKQSSTEHPPIVLRISKGTSRLISTDSEEIVNSPVQQAPVTQQPPAIASTEELLSILSIEESTKKQNITPTLPEKERRSTRSKTSAQNSKPIEHEMNNIDESKIATVSQDSIDTVAQQPQKHESLKIVIKTGALRNTLVTEKTPTTKTKTKKHKKGVKLTLSIERQLKTPSPQKLSPPENRTLVSPFISSERDFDSQSSVLGSISSKDTNQFPAVVPDESCVVRSRGSSDVTSDLETSQHSSLVAPPSDIESRLESMMDCDDDMPPLTESGVIDAKAFDSANKKLLRLQDEPLKEDILQVLTGGDSADEQEPNKTDLSPIQLAEPQEIVEKVDDINIEPEPELKEPEEESPTKRMTRSRRGNTTSLSTLEVTPTKTPKRTRNNKNQNNKSPAALAPPTRSYGRRRKNQTLQNTEQNTEIETNIENASANDLPDAPTAAANEICTELNDKIEVSTKPTTRQKSNITTSDETTTTMSIAEQKEYKIKNKFKRTWYERESEKISATLNEEDSSLQQNEDIQPVSKKFNNSTRNKQSVAATNNNNYCKDNTNDTNENGDIELPSVSGNLDDLDKPSVKLVISKKKGSIFKSRALVTDQDGGNTSNNKKRAIYKHTWDDEEENNKKQKSSDVNTSTPSDSGDAVFDDDFTENTITKFSRVTRQNIAGSSNTGISNNDNNSGRFNDDDNVTSVKCDRKAKDYYTVVRNVKTAHQIQEIGEYQEMKDDVDYILDALQPHNPISTRCLSALQLATKCMTPAFRMHVRAHGTATKFFKTLKDAKNDISLGLCTATIMFVLSQDTLNVDLDRDSLELMTDLLDVNLNPNEEENVIYERNKQKVRELCEELKNQGKAAHLNLDTISVGTLAMETLLSLTSKKAGEWFKEELRKVGGLEHIIKTICECCHQISDYVVSWTENLLDKLRTIERCLRILENVSQQNEKNQNYILEYGNGQALDNLFKLYKMCDSEIALYPTNDTTPKDNPGVVLREALVPTLKVLIILTHPFDTKAIGSALLGQRAGIFDTSFHILLQAPNYVPERCIFELSILVLLLLINLTMYTVPNRILIMKSHAPSDFGNQFDKVPAIKALIEYFYRCQEQALLAEQNTDEILENPESKNKKPQSQEEMDETVTKLLQKAGHHMEHTLQASYAGILIGHLISDCSENESVIRSYLRGNKFNDIVIVLEKYYNFMNLTASSEATVVSHIKSTKNLIDYFKKCDEHSNGDGDNDDEQQKKKQESELACTSSSSSSSNNIKNKNSDLSSLSTSGSSMSTRSSTTRYYKSYSQR